MVFLVALINYNYFDVTSPSFSDIFLSHMTLSLLKKNFYFGKAALISGISGKGHVSFINVLESLSLSLF